MRLIDADKLIEAHYDACNEDENKAFYTWSLDLMKNAPTANEWIPVKYHEITEEERESEGYPKEWMYYLDCRLPDDGEEILVYTGKHVTMDINYIDDGFHLDSGCDWIDIIAWMPIPTFEEDIPMEYFENGGK